MLGLSDKYQIKMKGLQIIFFFILFSIAGNAQYNIRINNILDNSYYINPAVVNDEYQSVLSIAARKQWIGFPGAPSTY